jgi:hypothetical protein
MRCDAVQSGRNLSTFHRKLDSTLQIICTAAKETADAGNGEQESCLCVGQWEMVAHKMATLRRTAVGAPNITHFDGDRY